MAAAAPARRWPLRVVLAIGVGVALAPAIFQMFSRAPAGGLMIDDFKPHMTHERIESFKSDLVTIGAAQHEALGLVPREANASVREIQARYPDIVAFEAKWDHIDEDMSSMLTTMDHNVDNYLGVAALPPFALFPWFFVLPGALIAGVAVWSMRTDGGGVPAKGRRIALVALAIGLIAAPAMFQMFTRAPGGQEMISDFKPFMRPAKVTEIQGYFLTIGTAEAEMRTKLLPAYAAAGLETPPPAIAAFNEQWPSISNEMAPMIGTMADSVGRFAGIAALPPFGLFPWFFVLPGVLVLGMLFLASRSERSAVPIPVLEGA